MTALKHFLLYVTLAVLIGVAYVAVWDFIVAQEPADTEVIVSNLTLNYIIFVLLVGIFVPWYVKKKYLPKKSNWWIIPIACIVGVLLILVLRLLGLEMRF